MKPTSVLAILASLAAFAKALPATDLWGCDADTATKCTASFNDCIHSQPCNQDLVTKCAAIVCDSDFIKPLCNNPPYFEPPCFRQCDYRQDLTCNGA